MTESPRERSTPPVLRSLSPLFDEAEHSDYVEILIAALAEAGDSSARNVALTGHYGSGKSSVLDEVRRRLVNHNAKVISLSLPSLGVGERSETRGDGPAATTTNLIQKEIVKQLLYRRRPSKTPVSRYNRLDVFQWVPATGRGVLFGALAVFIALVYGLPRRVQESLPRDASTNPNEPVGSDPAIWLQWASLVFVFVAALCLATWIQRLFHERIRIKELGTGSTKITLSEQSTSFFDEYLDEIVYFFQTSKTTVVIFEDLDRFEDPHIFETLRELNMLLNNADQTNERPIRFVYAIRDSIFEKLRIDSPSDEDDDSSDDAALDLPSEDDGETRRLTSTNRTKFFDIVVPMVPFISHKTSRDLIELELKSIEIARHRPSSQVVDVISAHLTDMRLIKNICNEYDVFRRRILHDDGLRQLNADRLFASIVYKNLYLADYEQIRNGNSRLDDLYAAYRTWVSQQARKARANETSARISLRQLDSVGSRSDELGERLQEVLVARQPSTPAGYEPTVRTSAKTYPWLELRSVEFWTDLLSSKSEVTVDYAPGAYPEQIVDIPLATLEVLMGSALSADSWTSQDRRKLAQDINAAIKSRRSAAQASMAEALAQVQQKVSIMGADLSLLEVAELKFGKSEIALDLLKQGFIDENFTLYVTQFPGLSTSASAQNFILKAVQPNLADFEYRFGADDDSRRADIEAVLQAEPTRLLGGDSVFNIEIFDHLLAKNSNQLDEPIRRLVDGIDDDREFIDAYIGAGKQRLAFITRLAGAWSGVFDYLIGSPEQPIDLDALNAALNGVEANRAYQLADEKIDKLEAELPRLEVVTKPQTQKSAPELAKVLKQLGIVVRDLGVVADPLRTCLIELGSYELSLKNLQAIVDCGESVELDRIKVASSDAYKFVLSRLDDYLAVLAGTGLVTVHDQNDFVDVLDEVGSQDPDNLAAVAERAESSLRVRTLDGVNEAWWPAITNAKRLTLTAANVIAYRAEYGLDESIIDAMTDAEVFEPEGATPSQAKLAVQIANEARLELSTKATLIASLSIPMSSVDPADIAADGRSLIPDLVASGAIDDDVSAWNVLEQTDYESKLLLVGVSRNFVEYMDEISFSQEDLRRLITNGPDEVRSRLLAQIDHYRSGFGQHGATAAMSWALRHRVDIDDASLVVLARAAESKGVDPVIRLLGDRAATITIDELIEILNVLGEPYDQLTSRGWTRPKVPVSKPMAAILQRLQSENIISTVKEKKGQYQVSKRRP